MIPTAGPNLAGRAMQHLSLGVGALLLIAAIATPAPVAGQLPGASLESRPSGQADWMRYQRVLADSVVRDLITVLEHGDHEGMARLFTDRGHLADATGRSARGREGVAALMERMPPRSGYRAQVSAVTASPRLVHAAGRVQFDGPEGRGSEFFDMVLEQHHGWWQIRALAFAPADDVLARSPLGGAVVPREDRVPLPERTLVRVVVEPVFAHEQPLSNDPGSRWAGYGAGIGVEFNRTLELRAFGRTYGGPTADEEITNYGAETRLYLLDLGRVRPFLAVGASRFGGSAAPDSAWVPTAGAGVSVNLLSYLDVQLSLRDHLVAIADGVEEDNWLAEKRSHRTVISAGVSLGLGRRPAWKDDAPTEAQRAYEAANSDFVLDRANALLSAIAGDDPEAAQSFYGAGARVYADGDIQRAAEEIFAALRGADARGSGHVSQLSISDRVAYVDMTGGTDGSHHLFTVLVQEDREWKVRFQVLHGG